MNLKFQMIDLDTGNKQRVNSLFEDEEFDAVLDQKIFQLKNPITDEMTLDVYVNGVKKREDVHFVRENYKEQIIFKESVAEGSWVIVRHWFHQ